MKLINSLSILPLIITLSILRADYTADVMFTDSEYNEIGPEYPVGTETVYFEVYDPDVSGDLDVVLSSGTDTEGETLTLNEVDGETGYFRGSIPVGVASTSLLNEDLLPARIEELRSQYPDYVDEDLRSLAEGQLVEEAINNPPANTYTREQDGILQVQSGDLVLSLIHI